jgi:hypothetical protein
MGALDMYGLHKEYIKLLKQACAEGVSEEQAALYRIKANMVRHRLNIAIRDFGKYNVQK